jgi:DNA-binding GntR family transcriptional regulator
MTTTLSPPPSTTKTEAAFVALREAIEEGRLAPGDRLGVKRLVDGLRMSPTPIREALRLLQAQGLAVYEPHHGMVVADYSPESIAEISRIRSLLEPLAVELAVVRASDEQVEEICRAHEALRDALRSGSGSGEAATLNANWHRALYRPANSPLLGEFISRLWSAVPVEAIWRSRRAKRSLAQHEQIMGAVLRHDAVSARDLMREHIEYGVSSTLAQLEPRRPTPRSARASE